MHRANLKLIVLLVMIGVAALALLPAGSTAKPSTVGIKGSSAADYSFKPKTLGVGKGSTVHWKWDSNAPHNVTFKQLGKHSATGSSGSFKLKFEEPGTYKYLCTIHGFKGTIVVK